MGTLTRQNYYILSNEQLSLKGNVWFTFTVLVFILYLLQCHGTNAMVLANDVIQMYSHLLLDEAQQMLLVHT